MKKIQLYKSPIKSIRLFILSSLFVIPSAWLLFKKNSDEIGIWFCLIFFGIGWLISIFNIIDRRPQIVIDKVGIWDRSLNQNVRWESINGAYELHVYKQIFITLDLNEGFQLKKNTSSWAKKLNAIVGAKDVNLNLSYIKTDIGKLISLIDILSQEQIEERDTVIELYRNKLN